LEATVATLDRTYGSKKEIRREREEKEKRKTKRREKEGKRSRKKEKEREREQREMRKGKREREREASHCISFPLSLFHSTYLSLTILLSSAL
jgi:hypothetical protein